MATPWPARKDAELVVQAAAMAVKIAAAPATYGLLAADATALTNASSNFTAEYEIAADPATRTKAAVAGKNAARTSLLTLMRSYGKRIEANLSVSAELKAELGLPARDAEPSNVPAPDMAPLLTVVSVTGRTARTRLGDAKTPSRRGRPAGVAAAEIFSYVGETPPSDLSQWTYEGSTTKTLVDIQFPSTVANWSKVWLAARWINAKMQPGPTATAETNLPGGNAVAA